MIVVAMIILVLCAVAHWISERDILYPPVVFSCLWIVLLMLVATSDAYDTVSDKGMAIYALGSVCFGVGSMFGSQSQFVKYFKQGSMEETGFTSTAVMMAAVCGMVILTWMILRMQTIAEDVGISNIMLALRFESAKGGGSALGLLAYPVAWLTFASIAAVVRIGENTKAKVITGVLVAIALLCQILSASRTGVGILLFGLAGAYAMKAPKNSYRGMLGVVAVFVGIFVLVASVLGKMNVEGLGSQSPVQAVALMARHYLISGVLAFDHVVQDPSAFKNGLHSFRFFAILLNGIGFNIHVPELVLDYVWIPYPTNIYTMYFPTYVDFGVMGVIAYTTIIGWITGLAYRAARSGSMVWCALYGLMFAKLLVSGITEHFIVSMSYWIQAAVVFTVMLGSRRGVERA